MTPSTISVLARRVAARMPTKRRLADFVTPWLLVSSCGLCTATAVSGPLRSEPDYLLRSWETQDGLPENSATAIVQSPQGYLWVGTFGGLVRFDGVRFTVYDQANTPELPSDGIVNLHLDLADRLWVSTLGGMAVLASGRWRAFHETDGWVGDIARTFGERANGDLLVTTFDGHVLEFVGDRFHALPSPPGEPGQGYHGFVDETGHWCVAQSAFVGQWDGQKWHETIAAKEVPRARVATAAAREGGQWILLGNELHKYHEGNAVVHRELERIGGGIWSMVEDSAGNLWICSYDAGLYRLDAGGKLRHWTTDNGLTFNGVRCIFEDREHNLWVGTSGGGLMQFAMRRASEFGEQQGLPGRVVNSVSADRERNVWIATYDRGLFRWDGMNVSRMSLSTADGEGVLTQSVLADSRGRVWVGTFGEGLWRIEGDQVIRIPDEQAGDGNILALFEDSQNRIWFGGGNGVSKFEAGRFHFYGAEHGLRGGGATCFAEDGTGKIWLANGSRVFRFNESGLNEVTDQRGQSLQHVLCLHADAAGGMWLGLATGGLLRWQDGEVRRIDTAHGLPADAVHGIVEDQSGVLWLATDRGVVRGESADFHAAADGQADLACQVLDVADGLPTDQLPSGRQPVCAQDANGRLWFATQKGAAVIDLARFRLNDVPPAAAVEEMVFYAPSREGDQRRAAMRETRLRWRLDRRVVLPPGSRRIEIRYTGLSLTAPSKVRFQVKLDGWDDQWQAVENSRVANYHELSPGDYVFRVRAANNDGVWSTDNADLAFTVMPFFWQTVWFRTGGAVLLVASSSGAAWWAAHARHRRRREADEQFRLVVEAAPHAMIVVDREGRMVLINPQTENVFGYDRGELIGQPIEMLVPERFRAAHPGLRNGYLVRPTARPMGSGRDLFGRRKDGSDVSIEVGLTPYRGSGGMLVLASIVDVTERRRQEAELARQRSTLAHLSRVTMLGELSGSLAHELNQPLTAILSNAQAAQRFMAAKEPDLKEVREILAEIVEDDNRAGEVIRRLRALFRKGDVAFERVDLATLIADVVKFVHGDAVVRHVAVDLRVETSLPPVRGDQIQLQQVMLNLLLNAFGVLHEAPASQRRVVVEARVHGQSSVRVSVRDNGAGLAADVLQRIFEPFFTTKSTGMGMGLSISRSIVESHGGELHAENNPNGGAVFWFTIPMNETPAQEQECGA